MFIFNSASAKLELKTGAIQNDGSANAVVTNGTFNMSGGVIGGDSDTTGGFNSGTAIGAGVSAMAGTFNMSGTAVISGNKTTSSSGGGAAALLADKEVEEPQLNWAYYNNTVNIAYIWAAAG